MTDVEVRFFEAFRLADKICKEELGTQDDNGKLGVTLYIKEMERCDRDGSAMVKNWNDDYKRLRRLVGERNELAHGVSVTSLTESDVEYINGFHSRLLDASDPLSLLRKARRAAIAPKPKNKSEKAVEDDAFYTPPAQRARGNTAPPKRDNAVPPKRDNGFVYVWHPEEPKRDENSKKWSTAEALAVSISVAALLLCAAVLALTYLGYLEF